MRYRSLDTWRGIACLMVVVYHVAAIPQAEDTWPLLTTLLGHGWLGVPLFFVISGYCIAATADSTVRHNRPVREYVVRRLRRIYPPYWLALANLAVVASLAAPVLLAATPRGLRAIPDPAAMTVPQWIGSLLLVEGWRTHVVWHDESRWFLETAWTLGYEEQFYAITGLLIATCRRQWLAGAAVLTLSVALVVKWLPAWALAGFFFDGNWLLFACGVGVFYHINWARGRMQLMVPAVLALAAAWATTQPAVSGTHEAIGGAEFFVAFFFGLALIALHPYDARMADSIVLKPLQWCGVRCYSMYLVHYPIAVIVGNATAMAGLTSDTAMLSVTLPVVIATVIGVSAAFHRWCEVPWLNRPLPAARDNAPAIAVT